MNKSHDPSAAEVTPADAPRSPVGTIGSLENLAGLAEDINSQAMARLSDPEKLDRAVKERFGPNATIEDVRGAMDAVRDLSAYI